MKALLICSTARPGTRQFAEGRPLATMPVFGECLVSHWVARVAELGAKEVVIAASERVDQVKAAVGDGERWGVKITFPDVRGEISTAEAAKRFQVESSSWLPPPDDVVFMNHLPGNPQLPLFETYSGWFAAIAAWMPRALTPARLGVIEVEPGIWLGRHAKLGAGVKLIAPCWIGDHVNVGAGAQIGPEAIIEDRCVVADEARIARSHIFPDTFVGRMTCVDQSIADGSLLTNWRTDSSLKVPDPFLLCALAPARKPPSLGLPARGLVAATRSTVGVLGNLAFGWLKPGREPNIKLPG